MLKVFDKGLVVKSKRNNKEYVVLGIDKDKFIEQIRMITFAPTKDDMDAMFNINLLNCYSILLRENMNTSYDLSLLSLNEKILLLFEFDVVTTIDVDLYNLKSNLVTGKNIQFISNEEARNIALERKKNKSINNSIFAKTFKEIDMDAAIAVGGEYCVYKNNTYYLVDIVKSSNKILGVCCHYKTRSKKDFLFHRYAFVVFFSIVSVCGGEILDKHTIQDGTWYKVLYESTQ